MKEGNNIQSIERAVSILDYLSKQKHGARLKEITDAVKLNKSTTFGLVSTLVNLNVIRQDKENGKYFLGIKILGLAHSLLGNFNMVNLAKDDLRKLAEKYDETVNLCLQSESEVIYVDTIQSSKSVRVEMGLGALAPINLCSTGKIFLAFMEEEEQNRILDSITFIPKTIFSITDKKQLLKELADVKVKGYAYDREEYEIGLTCVSCPIRKSNGEVVAAISLNAPSSRMAQIDQPALVSDMMKTANAIARKYDEVGL